MVSLEVADSPIATAIAVRLRSSGWAVEPRSHNTTEPRQGPITGLIYEPGLFTDDDAARAGHAVDDLLDFVDKNTPNLRPRADGGARIVVITSRDGLGWPNRPHTAATSGALVAAARSLALQLGPAGITVNVVAALPPEGSPLRDVEPPAGTHLREPVPLTPEPVTAEDIARTVEFFLNDRSGYITGQVLHCCGGASLLSSLSV
ncbi:SDR family oxidoreductase [Saccharopolyspora shandongensis]|uniref:SDR family oxidoreductase n=1 Tax=Saccharopolyspora shandongensis TaxID=418495 RepID=UPI0034198FB8